MLVTSSNDIENWLRELVCLSNSNACQTPRFIKPFHLATLTHALRRNPVMALSLPDKIGDYADTMMLWDALELESPFGPKNRKPGRYYPLRLLNDEHAIEDVAEELAKLFSEVCFDERTVDAVQLMLRELIGNCYAHSDVEDGLFGVICAQVWGSGRKAQITLADSGVGIRNSLRQNALLLDRLAHANSCELATEYGVTSKPGKGHSGYGLAVARKLLEQNNGCLYVRSGYEAYALSANRSESFTTPLRWDGTLLVIEWDLDTKMDIGLVYDSFPLPEGMNDDDFDF